MVTNSEGYFVEVSGERRVKDVLVLDGDNYVPIDSNKMYRISSVNFILINGGDGANMFMNCEVLNPNIMMDSEALTYYIASVMQGKLKDTYGTTGERITII